MGIKWLDEKQLLLCIDKLISDQEAVIEDIESKLIEVEHQIIFQSIKFQSGVVTDKDFKTVGDMFQIDDLANKHNHLLAEKGMEKEKLSKLWRFSELVNNSNEQRHTAIDTIQKLFD